MAWYYLQDQESIGPVDDAQFANLIAQGVIASQTWVWRAGMKDWKAYSDIPTVGFAGIWKRFCAQFCDIHAAGAIGAIGFTLKTSVSFMGFSLTQDETNIFVVFPVLISLYSAYETWMVSKYGATQGKMVMGLRVVRSDGSPITYMQAFARYWAKVLSGLLLGIGFIMGVFDKEKRGLHDRICGTRVIRIR